VPLRVHGLDTPLPVVKVFARFMVSALAFPSVSGKHPETVTALPPPGSSWYETERGLVFVAVAVPIALGVAEATAARDEPAPAMVPRTS
jgi:hypothetical protein